MCAYFTIPQEGLYSIGSKVITPENLVHIFFYFPKISLWFLNTYIYPALELEAAETFTGMSWDREIVSAKLSDLSKTKRSFQAETTH